MQKQDFQLPVTQSVHHAVRSPIFALALLMLPLGAGETLAAAADDSELRAAGPFPVGVTTAVLVDSNRTDAFTKEPRTLVTEIWYPATDDARQSPKNKYSDFLPGGVTPEIDAAVQKPTRGRSRRSISCF